RWRVALCGMDLLLTDLDFGLDTRRAVLGGVRDAFANEFRANADLKRQLGEKFRKQRKEFETLLDPGDAEGLPAPALAALRRRSEHLAPVAGALRAAALSGRLTKDLTALAPSYLHMQANRVLRSAQRAQEMVLYDFLARVYESRAARGRANGREISEQSV